MAIDGLLAQEQLAGDRLVGLAGGDQAQHLQLTTRQAMRARGASGASGASQRIDSRHVRHRAKQEPEAMPGTPLTS